MPATADAPVAKKSVIQCKVTRRAFVPDETAKVLLEGPNAQEKADDILAVLIGQVQAVLDEAGASQQGRYLLTVHRINEAGGDERRRLLFLDRSVRIGELRYEMNRLLAAAGRGAPRSRSRR